MERKPVTADVLLRDIRAHCRDCMGGHSRLVALCSCRSCSLWAHRLGKETPQALRAGSPARGSSGKPEEQDGQLTLEVMGGCA